MDWSAFDFLLAAFLLGGTVLLLRLVVRKPGAIAYPAIAVGTGAAAMAVGEADDAPGLVLFGLLLIAMTIGLSLKARQRSA